MSQHLEYVSVGEPLVLGHADEQQNMLSGHGTFIEQDRILSSVSGFVTRMNKLVSVHAPSQRYFAEVGDIVVGRVEQVAEKRWRVNVNGAKHAVLLLASVNLPGGVQRRRTEQDQLSMRELFKENDLISAEVQKIHHKDHTISLHTRTEKYGKLSNGLLVVVEQRLVKRVQQHFVQLECGVSLILGINGYIWVGMGSSDGDDDIRDKMCRVRNCIVALNRCFMMIFPENIVRAFDESLVLGLDAKDILDMADRVVQYCI